MHSTFRHAAGGICISSAEIYLPFSKLTEHRGILLSQTNWTPGWGRNYSCLACTSLFRHQSVHAAMFTNGLDVVSPQSFLGKLYRMYLALKFHAKLTVMDIKLSGHGNSFR